MTGETANDRTVLRVSGEDRRKFLQGLVTNDLSRLADGIVYAALLTPQGKYLADFFLVPHADALLLDVKTELAASLAQRLSMYRLRSDVKIGETEIAVTRGLGEPPTNAFADPRHAALGWRAYGASGGAPTIDWDAIRVANLIPETGIELVPNESYVLECGLDRLNGVDFRKGCYVGQEVTARMKHKTALKKGLAQVALSESVPLATPITRDGRGVGTVFTQSGGKGIAYLRFDRTGDGMVADGAAVQLTADVPA